MADNEQTVPEKAPQEGEGGIAALKELAESRVLVGLAAQTTLFVVLAVFLAADDEYLGRNGRGHRDLDFPGSA